MGTLCHDSDVTQGSGKVGAGISIWAGRAGIATECFMKVSQLHAVGSNHCIAVTSQCTWLMNNVPEAISINDDRNV